MPINMGYCRFQNTLAALRECMDSLSDITTIDPFAHLSESEQEAARLLVQRCRWFADDYGNE